MKCCRRLRADPRTATIPVLLITADSSLSTRLAGFDAGADNYLSKPFEPRELAARLRAHLELAGARCQLSQMGGVLATIRAISHEFNNPLQSIVGGLDLLQMSRNGEPVEEAEALAMLTEGTTRLSELARRLVHITAPSFKSSPIGTMLDIDVSK